MKDRLIKFIESVTLPAEGKLRDTAISLLRSLRADDTIVEVHSNTITVTDNSLRIALRAVRKKVNAQLNLQPQPQDLGGHLMLVGEYAIQLADEYEAYLKGHNHPRDKSERLIAELAASCLVALRHIEEVETDAVAQADSEEKHSH